MSRGFRLYLIAQNTLPGPHMNRLYSTVLRPFLIFSKIFYYKIRHSHVRVVNDYGYTVHTVLASGNPPFSYFPNIAIREVNIPKDVFPLLFLKSHGKRPPKYTIHVRQFFLVFTDVLVKWFSLGIAPYFDDHSAASGGNIHGVYVVLPTEKVRRYYFSNKRIKLKYCAHLCSNFLSLSPPVQPKICPDINNKCTSFTARNLSLHIVD